MVNINYKREIPLWVMLVIPFIYCFIIWSHLPDTIPTHFGMNGRPNGWMGRPAIFIVPASGIFTYAVLLLASLVDPKRKNYEAFGNTYYKIRLLLGVFLFAMAMLGVNAGLTGEFPVHGRLLSCLAYLLFAFIGNLIINIKPNWFIGIRTPWTLSNETVWKKTHQIGGRIWFYGSLLCIILTFLLPKHWLTGLLLVFIICTSLFSVIYSYWLYRKENEIEV